MMPSKSIWSGKPPTLWWVLIVAPVFEPLSITSG